MSAAPHLRLVDRIVDENGEVVDCPHCADARAEAETWEQEVLKLKREISRLKEDRAAKARKHEDYQAAYELFDEWRRETGHKGAKFEGDYRRVSRALAVINLYREDREKLSWVIQYGKHLAQVWRGEKQDSWGLLFRDSDHIEKYARAWWTHCRRLGVKP